MGNPLCDHEMSSIPLLGLLANFEEAGDSNCLLQGRKGEFVGEAIASAAKASLEVARV